MEEKKATKIRKLKLTSVDMVRRGANPDAHINLYKSVEGNPEGKPEEKTEGILKTIVDAVKTALGMEEDVEKKADTFDEKMQQREIQDNRWKYQEALNMSIESILSDDELSAEEKEAKMVESINQFAEAYAEMCGKLIHAYRGHSDAVGLVKAADEETLDEEEETPADEADEPEIDDEEEYEEDEEEEGDQEMKIDKSRFTAEELEMYNDLIAKGLVEDEEEEYVPAPKKKKAPVEKEDEVEKSDDVMKALKEAQEEMAELKKSMEMKELTNIAKKYTVLGKKEDELAQTLYSMKKSGQDVYDSYIAVLDQSVDMVEKSGMFTEIGKSSRNMGGGNAESRIDSIATEIQKADPSMSRVEAIAKAWEQHPELVEEYEANY